MSAVALPDRTISSRQTIRVLLVEDDPLIREVLAAALSGAGYIVHAEEDGSHVRVGNLVVDLEAHLISIAPEQPQPGRGRSSS